MPGEAELVDDTRGDWRGSDRTAERGTGGGPIEPGVYVE